MPAPASCGRLTPPQNADPLTAPPPAQVRLLRRAARQFCAPSGARLEMWVQADQWMVQVKFICLVRPMSADWIETPSGPAMRTAKLGRSVILLAVLAIAFSFASNSRTHAEEAAAAPSSTDLRKGSFFCDAATTQTALDLVHAGWTYVMPRPKSPKAAWGVTDGRTTWWNGYWQNETTHEFSSIQPVKDKDGSFKGNGLGGPSWRRGGSPRAPSKIEWLCSKSGGIEPEN